MILQVLASGSAANSYILFSKGEILLLEAGVRLSEVKKAINFNISAVVACLVSHSHKDHSGYAPEYTKAGIDVYAPGNVFWYNHNRNRPIQPGKSFLAGRFKVLPFDLEHDVPCLGYHIEHPDIGKLVFITDTSMCKYTFRGINHWLLEANYSDDILEQNIDSGRVHPSQRGRLLKSHMELKTTLGVLQANDMTTARTIVLLHLSDGNSHEERFILAAMEQTGKPVYAAKKGLQIDLTL